MLESQKSAGGTWAKERLYPGLKTNNVLGTYEFTDFPMKEGLYGVHPGEHISGHVVHEYVNDYAAANGVASTVRYQTRVESAEQSKESGWLLSISSMKNNAAVPVRSKIHAKKLILATGLTSQPAKVNLEGMDDFGGEIFHTCDFRHQAHMLNRCKTVAILGGNQSAWDVAYEFAASGARVEWIIRRSGHGPCMNTPSRVTPFKLLLERLINVRFLTWLSPCSWGSADGYGFMRQFFHGTAVGRLLVNGFWKILENNVLSLVGYDKHPETKKLKPWTSPFWMGGTVGILKYPTDFMELVRNGQIRIHIQDIAKLSRNRISLSDGLVVEAEALVLATGWTKDPNVKFVPESLVKRLGLPHRSNEANEMAEAADKEVLARFPSLRNQPIWNSKYKPLPGGPAQQASLNEPYRLYRFMIPSDPTFIASHDVGFVGAMSTFSNVTSAEIQSLWLTAYLDGKLMINKSSEDIKWETTLHSQFDMRRHPFGYGHIYPDLVFESMPYFDSLLTDLGLQAHRKNGRLAEWFEPYGPGDYKDIVGEWKSKQFKMD